MNENTSRLTAEHLRLTEHRQGAADWKHWGAYLSERQWGTVREDYSQHGEAWDYFPHDHARSRVYRWGEDGIAGLSDEQQRLCFALAFWNGRDPILKERLFGLTGTEGNHGEDVKEYYFYLDATPTGSYLKMLYKYPQAAFPYADLVETNRRRSKHEPEYELVDTGIFAEDRYFDIVVEYAKAGPDDILVRVSATNRGPDPAELHLLPHLWFRNTWSWGTHDLCERPAVRRAGDGAASILAEHAELGRYRLSCDGAPALLFTENESNLARLYGAPNPTPYVKDGINEAVVHGQAGAVNPDGVGTKAAAHYRLTIAPRATETIRLRLTPVAQPLSSLPEHHDSSIRGCHPNIEGAGLPTNGHTTNGVAHREADDAFADFDRLFAARQAEADDFYAAIHPAALTHDERRVQRQALAGLIWSKQYYYFEVGDWLKGDPAQPAPPDERQQGRNREWAHFNSGDIMSMPDTWEYPWFAAWDLAFHCVPFALIDPDFAKDQLILLGREWFQHPNGQVPAYEWAFGDVNPPVLAWASWRVYKIDQKRSGVADRLFLERVFHKLMLNFTWWVNRKDSEGKNVFQGGFLGLDNIGVFDRSAPLPTGGHIE